MQGISRGMDIRIVRETRAFIQGGLCDGTLRRGHYRCLAGRHICRKLRTKLVLLDVPAFVGCGGRQLKVSTRFTWRGWSRVRDSPMEDTPQSEAGLADNYSTINDRDAVQNLALDLERAQRGMVES
jgi:hypothetical protein